MIKNILIVPPSSEPVTLAEMKAHGKIPHNSDDVLLEGLLRSARQWCEHHARLAFMPQSWAVYVSQTPKQNYIVMPRGPLLSVTKVQMIDDKDQLIDLPNENFLADPYIAPPQVFLRDGASWPPMKRPVNSLRVEYVAGFGNTAADVPEPIKLAIKQLALHWYEHRGEAIVGDTISHAPLTIEHLLRPYRVYSMGGLET